MLQVPIDAFVFSLGTNSWQSRSSHVFKECNCGESILLSAEFLLRVSEAKYRLWSHYSLGDARVLLWGFFKYVGMGFSQLNINSLGSLPMTLTPSSFSKVPFYVTTDKPVFKDFFGKGRMGRPTHKAYRELWFWHHNMCSLKHPWGLGAVAQLVEFQLNMQEVLGLIPSALQAMHNAISL